MEMKRRTFLASTAAAAAAVQASNAAAQASGDLVEVKMDPWNQPPEVQAMWEENFLRQDDESRQDFTRGMMRFVNREAARPEAIAHQTQFLRAKGISPLDDVDMTDEQAFELMCEDPTYAARLRLTRTNFALHWDNPRRACYKDPEHYFGVLDRAEKMGPGKLELNASLDIPDSGRHEIHAMPGGYVGDPIAGWTYGLGHVDGTDDLRDRGRSVSYAQSLTVPKDRKVRRILDIGCSMGDGTMPIKLRFPNAEVWGIDLGAPMLRYAHYRASKLGIDVNYAQRNAENTGFPDNYFDMIGTCIVFHEVEPAARQRIIKEIYRILRPGGIYQHVDIITAGHPQYTPSATIARKAGSWVNHRHNVETWWPAYVEADFPGALKAAGFEVDFSGPGTDGSRHARGNFPPVAATKPV